MKVRYKTATDMFVLRSNEYITQSQAGASKEDLEKIRNEALSFAESSFDIIDEITFLSKKSMDEISSFSKKP